MSISRLNRFQSRLPAIQRHMHNRLSPSRRVPHRHRRTTTTQNVPRIISTTTTQIPNATTKTFPISNVGTTTNSVAPTMTDPKAKRTNPMKLHSRNPIHSIRTANVETTIINGVRTTTLQKVIPIRSTILLSPKDPAKSRTSRITSVETTTISDAPTTTTDPKDIRTRAMIFPLRNPAQPDNRPRRLKSPPNPERLHVSKMDPTNQQHRLGRTSTTMAMLMI